MYYYVCSYMCIIIVQGIANSTVLTIMISEKLDSFMQNARNKREARGTGGGRAK